MIRSFWPKCMATVGLERREKTYKELIVQLEKLELFIPEEAVKNIGLELLFLRRIQKSSGKKQPMIKRARMIKSPGNQDKNPASCAR